MVVLVITKKSSYVTLAFQLRQDTDVEMVRQITDRLGVYLEKDVKFEFRAT